MVPLNICRTTHNQAATGEQITRLGAQVDN
jgi:hypothetical protein